MWTATRSSATAKHADHELGKPFGSGVDAPEISGAKCQKERILGQQTKRCLEVLLRRPGTQIDDSGDRYGWQLVWMRVRNSSTAGAVLLSEAHAMRSYPAIPWTGAGEASARLSSYAGQTDTCWLSVRSGRSCREDSKLVLNPISMSQTAPVLNARGSSPMTGTILVRVRYRRCADDRSRPRIDRF